MDPDTAVAELLDAVGRRQWDRVEELATGLLDWLQRRGFPPTIVGPKTLGPEWHRAIATFICRLAQSKVNDARKRRARKRGA
jgi:hypothetical protein